MVKAITSNVWKPLDIEGIAFNKHTEGLIGIEECTDYNLDDIIGILSKKEKAKPKDKVPLKSKVIKKAEKKKSAVKKKIKEIVSDNEISDEAVGKCVRAPVEDKQPDKKKAAVKKKKNKKVSTKNEKFASTFTKLVGKCVRAPVEDRDYSKLVGWDSAPLPQVLLDALYDQGFYQPTEIQTLTLPAAVLGKRDILGAAETGSGKTLAFGLPIISGILNLIEKGDAQQLESTSDQQLESTSDDDDDESESDFEETEEDVGNLDNKGIGCVRSINNVEISSLKNVKPRKSLYALILTPTRELAVQIKDHLVAAAKHTDIRVAVVVGGMAAVKQERVLSKGPEIVVATPGRLWELIQQGNEHLSQIDNIRFLAIDETDRMIEKGHFQELHHILERINFDEKNRTNRQNFVFSATLTLVHELPNHLRAQKKFKIKKFIKDMTPAQKLQRIIEMLGISNPKVVDITTGRGTSGTLTECRITCGIEQKDYYVYYFLKRHPGRTIIFCNSIGCVRRLTTLLGMLECSPLPIHAQMQQRQRLKNLDRFRERDDSILVATDVAARGLDIPSIQHVIHYQTPRTSESYIHRSGRTARASKEGITILLVEPSELPNYLRLCRTLEKSEDIPLFPIQANYLNAVKKRVELAREMDKLELQVRKSNSEAGWYQKAAEDMDIIVDDVSLKYDIKQSKNYKKVADIKRKQLSQLLQKPIFPGRGISGKYPLTSNMEDFALAQGETQTQNAIDVMKNALETKSTKEIRKKSKALFKPRMKKTNEEIRGKELMKRKDKKSKAINKGKKNRKNRK